MHRLAASVCLTLPPSSRTHPPHRLMSSDALWEPWLAKIRCAGYKSLLEELRKAKTLEFLG